MDNTGKKNGKNLFSAQIALKERRKLKTMSENKSVWFGLGMFGMVGWSVVVPAVAGALIGVWLDKKHPVAFSWTVSLLIAGLVIGCLIAWYWVRSEDKEIH
jgi:ATP synthase protein I